ncbi:MAG TPA: methyltransferase domain-containing protein [Spirochaetia bacterium]|nr:methyltransferase domain-containing protein [Spirochaetia bacterium]
MQPHQRKKRSSPRPWQDDIRKLPRTSCHIESASAENPGIQILSIDNLSVDGLLVSYIGHLQTGEILTLNVAIPEEPRPLRLQGKTMHVLDDTSRKCQTAGVRLFGATELEERRLNNLIMACSSGSMIRNLYDRLQVVPSIGEHRLEDHGRIAQMLRSLVDSCVPVSLQIEGAFTMQEQSIVSLDEQSKAFSISWNHDGQFKGNLTGREAYFAFSWNGGSHYFKATSIEPRQGRLSFHFPVVVLRSQNRAYVRRSVRADHNERIQISSEESPQRTFTGFVIDISRRGFLCEILVPPGQQELFSSGKSVHYVADDRLGIDFFGQIRHARTFRTADGVRLRLGIEAGILRRDTAPGRLANDEWDRGMPYQGGADGPSRPIESLRVSITNSKGQQISGLLNATRLPVEAPVVVIPPAYGKKKEAYSPLVATILATFWAQGKDIAILRYDGINRPGESHQDVADAKRGYEMLSYRWSQGAKDLRAALAFVRKNPHFAAQEVVLITFSMSAVEARRLLGRQPKGIKLWVSCMGAPSAQSTLRNVLGGIDVISNYRAGIPNGIMGLLGHLVDMDRAARDMVREKYANQTDARLDMSRIKIPVFWIYGRYDKWIDPEDVVDLMSVEAGASRELLEIPAGHNLRTSNDAIQTFKLITGFVYEKLHGEHVVPRDPSKENMVSLLSTEREALERRSGPSISEYWREYLIGSERSSVGYDFYRNIEEFTGFLRSEARSLELDGREIVADFGCGTGLFLEVLLGILVQDGKMPAKHEITAVDLVQEALEKTKAKCDRLIGANPALQSLRMRYVQGNLEPNRLIPVAEFVRTESLTFDFLRGKIDGLSNATVDRLTRCASPVLSSFMRGGVPSAETVSYLESVLEGRDLAAVLDFNRAARYLFHEVRAEDLQPDSRSREVPPEALRTKDLGFACLDFGDHDRNLQLPFHDNHFTRIVASLFISYIFNPQYAAAEFYRMLRPGGLLLISSMKPDSDISLIFANFIDKLHKKGCDEEETTDEESGLSGALGMLNEAAGLFELEEDGFFKFYTAEELKSLLLEAGFSGIEIQPGMGSPPQAYMAIARKPIT